MNDKALVVAAIDMLTAAKGDRFANVALPADDAIAHGPSAVYADSDVDAAISGLRKALNSEAETLAAAKQIRGILGTFSRALGIG